MTQKTKSPAEANDQHSILKAHIVKGESEVSQIVLWFLQAFYDRCTHHTHTKLLPISHGHGSYTDDFRKQNVSLIISETFAYCSIGLSLLLQCFIPQAFIMRRPCVLSEIKICKTGFLLSSSKPVC